MTKTDFKLDDVARVTGTVPFNPPPKEQPSARDARVRREHNQLIFALALFGVLSMGAVWILAFR